MASRSPRRAVFLDRDGTLIEDRGFLGDPSEAVLFPDTVPALLRLQGEFALFIVTNQSGIGRGLVTADAVARVNRELVARLAAEGVHIRDVYTCPHVRDDGCACMKPGRHFLDVAAREHGIDLTSSFVIGDHPSDVELARNAGCTGIYVLTGHGARHRGDLTFEPEIVEGIREAGERVAVLSAARTLRAGGLVAFPTETVYGLGADAANDDAVRRIFAVKGRPTNHPLIVHFAEPGQLPRFGRMTRDAERLAERFWPGPLTLILPRTLEISDVVTGGQSTVGLRVPAHGLARAILAEHGGGVAAPSANRFGRVSPTEAAHVVADLGPDVDLVVDGGPAGVGVESTIVDLASDAAPTILRPGGVTREALEDALHRVVPVQGASTIRAPGLLASHYAPKARVLVVEPARLESEARACLAWGAKVAVLATRPIAPEPGVLILDAPRSPEDFARALYRALRRADQEGADVVVVERPSEVGIGLALLDRLLKAAANR